jgi:colanic acid/amylovoran biosynthesis glycosyltransferase
MNYKKLLIITPTAPTKDSTFIKSQINSLQPYSVLHSGFRPYLNDGKSIFNFPVNFEIIRIAIKRILPKIYKELYDKALSRFLSLNKYDLVLCNYGPQASNVYNACTASKVPLVAHFHGYDASIHSVISEYRQQYSLMFEGIAAIISVSNEMTSQLIKLGAAKASIHTIPYGVNLDFFSETQPENNPKKLIFVGRFTEKKAPDLLLNAFNIALQKVPDAKLIMIGNGELSNFVVQTIKALKIEHAVQILPWQTPDEIVTQLKNARAYVQHSRIAKNGDSEGTPNSILEASACGLPVISTYHAGIKEAVIHGVTGYLVDEGDWRLMGVYMTEYLENPEIAGEMGRAGRKHITENYALNCQNEKLKGVLSAIANKKV